MTPADFLAALPRVAHPLHWFADFTGANLRTVRRWVNGSQDIPGWVPVLLLLRHRLEEGLAWSVDRNRTEEQAWRDDVAVLLWVTRGRARAPERYIRNYTP